MVTMMTYFSLSVMAPLYFEEAAGLAASMAGVLMVAPVLANATASVLSGRALDRWGEWPLLPTGLAIAVTGLAATIAGALTGSLAVATTGIFFGYLGTGMVLSPAQTAGLRRLPDELDSHGVTLMSMAVQLSACLGPAASPPPWPPPSSWPPRVWPSPSSTPASRSAVGAKRSAIQF